MPVTIQGAEALMTDIEHNLWAAAVETRQLVGLSGDDNRNITSVNAALLGLIVSSEGLSVVAADFDLLAEEAKPHRLLAQRYIHGLSMKEQHSRRRQELQTEAATLFDGLFFDLSLLSGQKMEIQYPFDSHYNTRMRSRQSVKGRMDEIDLTRNALTVRLSYRRLTLSGYENITTVPILDEEGALAIRIRTDKD